MEDVNTLLGHFLKAKRSHVREIRALNHVHKRVFDLCVRM